MTCSDGEVTARDEGAIEAQLGRPPRSIHAIGHRCPCGNPDVVATEPRLEDGTPFPTTFYLTCPRAASMIGTLEASGLMKEMSQRLEEDQDLAGAYRRTQQITRLSAPIMGEPQQCAKVIARAVASSRPRARYLVGYDAQALAAWDLVTPTEVKDRVLRLLLGL